MAGTTRDRATRRAGHLGRREYVVVTLAVLVISISALLVFNRKGPTTTGGSPLVAGPGGDLPTAAEPTTQGSPLPAGQAAEPPIAAEPGTTEGGPKEGASTAPSCHNSTDSSCGAFRWVPTPPKRAPIDVQIDLLTTHPEVGQPVEFSVDAQHPYEQIDPACGGGSYGDGVADPRTCSEAVCSERFGAWDLPAPRPGHLRTTYRHTYVASGSYTVSFSFVTAPSVCGSPYESTGTAAVVVKVGLP